MDTQGLSAICAGLGIVEEDDDGNRIGYSKGSHCLDNLKDLLRFLRRDDPQTREVFKQVCKWNCVSKDLIPILEHCQDDRSLVLNTVKVLVFLTMPIEPTSSDIPLQVEYLWDVKSAITVSDTVAVIISLLESPLENLESEVFTEDDWKLVQLVLTLFRNLLAIQGISALQKAAGFATQILSLRDRFLELLFRENVMDLFLLVAQHVGGSSDYLHQDNWLLLEIFYYIFHGQDPQLVAKAHLNSHKDAEAKTSLSSLKSIIEEEKDKRRLSRLQYAGRYSHFSGTFERFAMDGSKAVLKGSPNSSSLDVYSKSDKFCRGPTKKIVWDQGRILTTTDNILKLLHGFLNQFLSGGYNVLMQSVREDIEREQLNIQRNDVVYFFEFAKFVTSFQYHKFSASKPNAEMGSCLSSCSNEDRSLFSGDICGPIAASMNESMFLMVISKWRDAFDGLKETKDYKFLSAAGSLLKAMIRALDLVLKLLPENSREPQTARVLLYKLFYDQTDQGMTHFLLNLVKSFDVHKQPRSDLADLVEVIHTIMQLMERLQDRGTLRVTRKSRKRRTGKRGTDKVEAEMEPSADCLMVQDEIAIPSGEKLASGDKCHQDGQLDADSNGGEAGILLDADISEKHDESTMEQQKTDNNLLCSRKSDPPRNLCYSTGDSSGDEQIVQYDEVDFKVSTVVSAFANNGIIHNLCWLLKFYKSNSINTNRYILSILSRIANDLELSPMLYELSLLTIFHEILVEQKFCPNKECTEIVNFLTNLVRKMLRKMKQQPLLFVEVLFWKTRKECHYINAEYLLHEVGKLKKQNGYGEIGSKHATGWVRRSIADALGEDEADVVISHDLGYQKDDADSDESPEISSPIDVNAEEKLERENSLDDDHGKVSKRKRRLVLSHELDSKIRDLYEKFKDEQKCNHLIAEAVDPDCKVSPAQVGNKLKQLGLRTARRNRIPYNKESTSWPSQPEDGEDAQERGSLSLKSRDLINHSTRLPFHARKRVRALSEDQEAAIRSLFEKFKDHKRCSYMIANALDGDKVFTPAQIARKLKQLGLRAPREKKVEAALHLRDENLSDHPADETQDSDNETLLSLRLRGRNKENEKLFSSKLQSAEVEGRSLEDDSDDETLSSVLNRKLTVSSTIRSFANESIRIASTEGTLLDRESDGATVENSAEGDERDWPINVDATGGQRSVSLNSLKSRGTSEVEITGSINDDLGSPIEQANDAPLEKMENELEDSGDYVSSTATAKKAIGGRRLRVVFDDEED
ncbi:protein timeless homolog isoform X2 [Rhodamnia argentea]|uniref:Protein timeless homolog isoform X2 n=1 Tax=Rhodamnia argentea TaxID=178133 RepID=A0A8B8QNJ0_9MYRT|nr:protein timeless homolog isoform X2 [Rhodamnia argentea]